MLVIGETLNAVIPKVGQAVVARDAEAITTLARGQVEWGAQMLDVNAGGLAGRDEWYSAYLQAYRVGKLDGK
ncbi:MAG: hypothetical protein WC935_02100 [Thermoleophilia bacterium]